MTGDILFVVGQIVLLILIGALLRRVEILKPEHATLLNSIVINLTLPATVFLAVRKLNDVPRDLWGDLLKVPLVAYIVIGVSGLLAHLVTRWLRMNRRTAGAMIITAMFGTTAFLGYPLVRGLFGKETVEFQAAVFYSELGTLIPILTVAVVIASRYGEGERFTWRNLLAVLKFGPFVALLIGLLFFNETIPGMLLGMLDLLSGATVPLIMLSLGITLRWGDFLGRHFKGVLALNLIKLLLAPLLALALSLFLDMRESIRAVTVLMSALPSLMLCLSYANQYKLDIEFASNALFASFFFGAVSIPIVAVVISKVGG